jgi:hypothetical protein
MASILTESGAMLYQMLGKIGICVTIPKRKQIQLMCNLQIAASLVCVLLFSISTVGIRHYIKICLRHVQSVLASKFGL